MIIRLIQLSSKNSFHSPGFLLLARYVPEVVKRSIWDQRYIDDRSTDQRPTSVPGRAFLEELQTAISL